MLCHWRTKVLRSANFVTMFWNTPRLFSPYPPLVTVIFDAVQRNYHFTKRSLLYPRPRTLASGFKYPNFAPKVHLFPTICTQKNSDYFLRGHSFVFSDDGRAFRAVQTVFLELIHNSSNICSWRLIFTFCKQLNICPGSLPSFKHVQSNSNPTNRVSRSLRTANHKIRQLYSILNRWSPIRINISITIHKSLIKSAILSATPV